MNEPRLTDEDRRIWESWRMACEAWSRSRAHKRRVKRAMDTVREMAAEHPDAYVAWSAGKDSTALAHLVFVECGVDTHAMSIKDDLDFPGEKDYLRTLGEEWGVQVEILEPDFSLQQWLADHADEIDVNGDFHGRASAFSDRAFYSLIEDYRRAKGMPGVYLGMRQYESHGRQMNRALRGAIYTKRDGETVCQPIVDWEGRDVYAYLFSRDIPVLDVYRCVRFHDSPSNVRKSWWLPCGAGKRYHRGLSWLRAYYPSLYLRLCEILPSSSQLA